MPLLIEGCAHHPTQSSAPLDIAAEWRVQSDLTLEDEEHLSKEGVVVHLLSTPTLPQPTKSTFTRCDNDFHPIELSLYAHMVDAPSFVPK